MNLFARLSNLRIAQGEREASPQTTAAAKLTCCINQMLMSLLLPRPHWFLLVVGWGEHALLGGLSSIAPQQHQAKREQEEEDKEEKRESTLVLLLLEGERCGAGE